MTVIRRVLCSRKKLNVYSSGDKSNPGPDTHKKKTLHVRYITLQELISAANSKHHSIHPAYGHNAVRPPKASEGRKSGAASLLGVRRAIVQTRLSEHNAFISATSWHAA